MACFVEKCCRPRETQNRLDGEFRDRASEAKVGGAGRGGELRLHRVPGQPGQRQHEVRPARHQEHPLQLPGQ